MSAPKGNPQFKTNNPAFDKNHPRRCQAKLKGGRKCGNWAMKGIAYCKFHGGAAVKAQREKISVTQPRPKDMARLRFYSKRLGPKLEEFVAQCIEQPETEQLQLFEELALMRALAGEAIQLFSAASEIPESNPKRHDLILNAGMVMQTALEQVRVMAKTASDISAAGKDKFSVHALHDVKMQLLRIVDTAFGHLDQDALDNFANLVETQLRLPKVGVEGTTITPDSDVMQMDELVPYVDPTTQEQPTEELEQ
jgi:hypothetical protein